MGRRFWFALVVLGLIAGMAGCSSPSNYDECILEHMGGAASREAVLVILGTCRRQFPEEKKGRSEP